MFLRFLVIRSQIKESIFLSPKTIQDQGIYWLKEQKINDLLTKLHQINLQKTSIEIDFNGEKRLFPQNSTVEEVITTLCPNGLLEESLKNQITVMGLPLPILPPTLQLGNVKASIEDGKSYNITHKIYV